MKKTIEVEFTSQSKSVTAHTSIMLEGDDNTDSTQVLEEAKALFSKAEKYAIDKTFERSK